MSNKRSREDPPPEGKKVTKIVLQVMDGTVEVSKTVHEGDIDISTEIKRPMEIITTILEWMNSAHPIDCKSSSMSRLLNIYDFAKDYKIQSLHDHVFEYFAKMRLLDSEAVQIANAVLKTYSGAGTDIYEMAINTTVEFRKLLHSKSMPCCTQHYYDVNCCVSDFVVCENQYCCRHRTEDVKKELETRIKIASDNYLGILEGVPLTVHEDIAKYDMSKLILR